MSARTVYVVVGAGAMGLATTWQLARAGHVVIALERFERGHVHGASHGATRNFNNAYAEDHYLDLLSSARTDDARVGGEEGVVLEPHALPAARRLGRLQDLRTFLA